MDITTTEQSLITAAQEIACQWGFNFTLSPQNNIFLQLSSSHLQLVQIDKSSPGPIFTDFTSGQIAHRRIYGGGKGQIIARAVGLNKMSTPVILDATAGMGKDAFIFASLGARVILMERSMVAAALLTDALHRAAQHSQIADIINRMEFIFADARLLGTDRGVILDQQVDVIYLDPMFPHRKKSALVKKEMLAFQQLIGDDADSDELLPICRQQAKKRVVVKRPLKAPYLNNTQPSLSMTMKRHRFDIYFT